MKRERNSSIELMRIIAMLFIVIYHLLITVPGSSVQGILQVRMLQKPVIKKPSTTLGELENSGLLCRWAQRS